jgi:hypothetical protein
VESSPSYVVLSLSLTTAHLSLSILQNHPTVNLATVIDKQVMQKSFLKTLPDTNTPDHVHSKRHSVGMLAFIAVSVLLPFYLLDPDYLFHQDDSGHSVFMNAVRFYSGINISKPDADHFIAVVTYLGISNDRDDVTPADSINKIIQEHAAPVLIRKGFRLDYKTNNITRIHFYYKNEHEPDNRVQEVKVFCFVTCRAAFALVVA